MNKKIFFFTVCVVNFSFLFSHEGHKEISTSQALQSWIQWFGNFHHIFLHFPFVLITMTVISECLSWRYKKPFFDHASRFMLIAGAVFTIPTIITGLAFSYLVSYNGNLADIFWWHRFLGFFVTALSFLTVILKELTIRKTIKSSIYYFASLLFLFISIYSTSYLGGQMTFSSFRLSPPF